MTRKATSLVGQRVDDHCRSHRVCVTARALDHAGEASGSERRAALEGVITKGDLGSCWRWSRRRSPPCSTATASTLRSGNLTGFFGVAVPPVFSSDLGRHLLGELRELLDLRGHGLELLACVRA